MNILVECDRRGIRIEANGDMLKVDAPKGALSPDLLTFLKDNKTELLAALRSRSDTEAAEDLREHFEERAAILEHEAGLPRHTAELEAARMTCTLARNNGYTWASLRAALAGHDSFVAAPPSKDGVVDGLPLGLAKLVVLKDKDKRVVRQGVFNGPQEVGVMDDLVRP